MSEFLVTGATGAQGGAVARLLLACGHRVRALTRNTESPAAAALREAGAAIVAGDFDDAAVLRTAMEGTDGVFAMGTAFSGAGAEGEVRQGKALIDAARAVGIGHFLYSSSAGTRTLTGVPHTDSKREVEEYLAASGLASTVIGPHAFLDSWIPDQFASGQLMHLAAPDVPIAWIAVDDIAAFAVYVLENRAEFVGKSVEIASFTASAQEIAAEVGGVTYEQMSLGDEANADMQAMLDLFGKGGVPSDVPALHAAYPDVAWHSLSSWVEEKIRPQRG
ncbi:NmrA/HSCARG family protein [Streptomyces sp. NPDC050636]|uniref:NmrA/HSCARG family protein n=1 Tax=Streptomyces sp. NPDC050636 TaxID=3154510 RepID=UPI00342A87F3